MSDITPARTDPPAGATPGNGPVPTIPARPRHANGVLAVIVISQLMVVLDGTVVNIAIPHIRSSLHMQPAELSWVLNAYGLTFGGLLLLGARAGDLRGRRKTFLVGIAIFTVASLAAGLSDSSALLLAARAAQGVGGALASPSALALLTIGFPEGRERLRALAYFTAVSIGGTAVGLVVGGLIVGSVSWRWIFFINLPVGAALIVLARAVLPETEPRRGSLDLTGALTSTLGMSALVFALVRAATGTWGDPVTIVSLAAGGALLVGFVLAERRAVTPITPLHLFADRSRSVAYVARVLVVAAGTSIFFFLSQYLQEVLGYSPVQAGLSFVPITVCLFASSQLSAHVLARRVPARVQLVTGLTLSAAGLYVLSGVTVHSAYSDLIVPLVLFGIGNGLSFMVITTMGLSGVAHEDAGAASGLLNAAQQVGGALGLAVLVSIFGSVSTARAHQLGQAVSAQVRTTVPFVAGTHVSYQVAAAGLAGLALLVSLVRIPKPSDIEMTEDDVAEAVAAEAGAAPTL
ncbi:MAG: MFS transporter [Acidobacteriota bacterium]|nr:MFS transporter [Acidobacteriota bacterium]